MASTTSIPRFTPSVQPWQPRGKIPPAPRRDVLAPKNRYQYDNMLSRPRVEEERRVTQAPTATGQQDPARPLSERPAASVPGVGILAGSIVALVAGIVLVLAGIFQSDLRGLIVLGI